MKTDQEIRDYARARFPGHIDFSYEFFARSLNTGQRITVGARTATYQRQCDIEDLCLMDWGLARSLIFVALDEGAQRVKFRYCDNPKLKEIVERERRRLFPPA